MSKTIVGKSILLSGADKNFRKVAAKKMASESSSKFDTMVIDTLDTKGIDTVREIRTSVSRKPYDSQLTSVIILEAQRLTSEAQNALLKILEEPNDNCQLILTAPSKDSLLPTVGSRLSEINLTIPKSEANDQSSSLILIENSFSKRLAFIEKSAREDYLDFWANKLKQTIVQNDSSLKSTHRYNKLIIKMLRAEKSLVNKKLIDLILALDS